MNATEDKDKLANMPYIKLYTGDIDALGKCFSPAQIGTLLLAVNAYAKDGTIQDVPVELRYPLHEYVEKIKASRKKYAAICAKRAVAASKGGKAKAAKNHAQTVEQEEPEAPHKPEFRPPTKKQFMDAMRVLRDGGDIEATNQETENLYSMLQEASWRVCGAAIAKETDWKSVLLARFFPYGPPPLELWQIFSELLTRWADIFKATGEPTDIQLAQEIAEEFYWAYEKDADGWTLHGRYVPLKKWTEGLAVYAVAYGAEDESAE